jgi:hypothetical protein
LFSFLPFSCLLFALFTLSIAIKSATSFSSPKKNLNRANTKKYKRCHPSEPVLVCSFADSIGLKNHSLMYFHPVLRFLEVVLDTQIIHKQASIIGAAKTEAVFCHRGCMSQKPVFTAPQRRIYTTHTDLEPTSITG